MKVISLNCNHCGAPLDAPVHAKFLTCSFCESRLTVQRTGTSYSTVLIEELRDKTEALSRDVAAIKQRSDVEKLDRQWEVEKRLYLIKSKNGHSSIPTVGGAIATGVVGGGFGIFWFIMTTSAMSFASVIGSGSGFGHAPSVFQFLPFLGLLFAGLAVFQMFRMISIANGYEQSLQRYRRKRRQLLETTDDPQ